jgi:hypothetical protein
VSKISFWHFFVLKDEEGGRSKIKKKRRVRRRRRKKCEFRLNNIPHICHGTYR